MFRKIAFSAFAFFAAHGAMAAPKPIASLSQATLSVEQVTVYDNGTIEFESRDAGKSTVALTDAAFAQVRSLVTSVAQAEILTTHQMVVCMMMPVGAQSTLSVASGYDYGTGQFADDLKAALSPQGCWVSTHIAPKNPWVRENALELVALLRLLANQLAG